MQNTLLSQIEYCKRELKNTGNEQKCEINKTLNKQPSLVKPKFSRQNLDEWLQSHVVVHDHLTVRDNMEMKNRNLSWESFGGVGEGRGGGVWGVWCGFL